MVEELIWLPLDEIDESYIGENLIFYKDSFKHGNIFYSGMLVDSMTIFQSFNGIPVKLDYLKERNFTHFALLQGPFNNDL